VPSGAALAVWITDGSVPVFSDTVRLRVSHRGPLGLPVRYEGFVDPDVPRGSAEIVADRSDDALFVEAEWCVEWPDKVGAEIDDSTPIVLQGLIEGKWLNRLLGTRAWIPASIANNVLAVGSGIPTSLAELEGGAAGEIRIEYERADRRTQVHRAAVADLRGHNVAELVREVIRVCAARNEHIGAIDLGAIGEQAAVVNEKRRLRAAMRPLPNPLNAAPHRAKERLVRAALAESTSVPEGVPATLTATDANGVVVGAATLTWRRGAS
jgi:hypothetical protein